MVNIRYAIENDFDYIYKLSSKNSNLLGIYETENDMLKVWKNFV